MLVHIGTSPAHKGGLRVKSGAKYVDPAHLEDAIRKFPDTNFLLCNVGFDHLSGTAQYLPTCLELAQDYPNVWLGLNGMGSGLGAGATESHIVKVVAAALTAIQTAGLVGRCVYGSACDGPEPENHLARYLQCTIQAMQLSRWELSVCWWLFLAMADSVFCGRCSIEDMRAIFSGNFLKLFAKRLPRWFIAHTQQADRGVDAVPRGRLDFGGCTCPS